jgi:hypothetical protein
MNPDIPRGSGLRLLLSLGSIQARQRLDPPAWEITGPGVSEMGTAARSPAAVLELGVAHPVRDRPGDLGPGRRLVGVGLAVAGLKASSMSGLVHLTGQLQAVPGFRLGVLGLADGRSYRVDVHAPASISRSAAFCRVHPAMSWSTTWTNSGVMSGSGGPHGPRSGSFATHRALSSGGRSRSTSGWPRQMRHYFAALESFTRTSRSRVTPRHTRPMRKVPPDSC